MTRREKLYELLALIKELKDKEQLDERLENIVYDLSTDVWGGAGPDCCT